MNLFNKIAITGLSALILNTIGCIETKITESEVMTEKGYVELPIYSPSKHGTGIGPSFDLTGDGGIGVAITSVDFNEKYGAVFTCEHGDKFIIVGETDYYKDLWKKLRTGDSVIISYKEQYEETWEDGVLLEKKLIDYDFLDAEPFSY